MRFTTLRFAAFGPFTELELDLSGGAPGGLHVVFGRNEAGKSTALRGVHDLLFGIPERTQDAHLHANAELRIQASLVGVSGEQLEVSRIKRRKDSLRDRADAPLDEACLARLLGGMDEKLFERLFGLDHLRLQQAAEALLEDHGDIGESLFDAGSGGRSIRHVLDALELEADALFKPRATKSKLHGLLESYRAAKGAVREAVRLPEKWLEQTQNLEAKRVDLTRASEARKRLREEHLRLTRLEPILVPVARRDDLERRLAELGPLPTVPVDAAERRVRAEQVLEEAARERARIERERALRSARRAELALPERLLELGIERVERLRDGVGKFRSGRGDLPKRVAELRASEEDASKLRKALYAGQKRQETSIERPSAVALSRVRRLAQARPVLVERLDGSRRELAKLRAELASCRKKLERVQPTQDLVALERAELAARHAGDIDLRRRDALEVCERLLARGAGRLRALGLWMGSLEAAAELAAPSLETVERFGAELRAQEQERDGRARESALVERRLADVEQDIASIESGASVPSETELVALRARRSQGFGRVLAAWQRGAPTDIVDTEFDTGRALASAVESAMLAADDTADRLRREAQRVSELASLRAERDRLRSDRQRCVEQQAASTRALHEIEARWQAAWRETGIVALSPGEMRAWLSRHQALKDGLVELADARVSARRLAQECGALEAELSAALGSELAGLELAVLLRAAQDRLLEAAERARERKREAATETDLIERQAALAAEIGRQESELAASGAEWAHALGGLGFDADLAPEEAHIAVDGLGALFSKLDEVADRRRRVQGIERDVREFESFASELITEFAPDLAGLAADAGAERLALRYQAAERDAAELFRINRELGELEAESAELQARAGSAERDLDALMRAASASDRADLVRIEERTQNARELVKQIAALDEQLIEAGGGLALEAVLTAARAAERTAIAARLSEIEEERELLEETHQNLSHEVKSLEQGLELYADTEAVDRAQELAACAAEIRQHSARYAELRLSALVLRREVERYREQNQGPVLKRAGELFPRLTLGKYRGLRAGVEDRVLVTVRDDGREVHVPELSEGARFQLYLALRLASLERYLEKNLALPLVLDDVLIHFDDERAQAALGVLGELAERLQILFFTHHSRDVELARRAVPSRLLFTHELGSSDFR